MSLLTDAEIIYAIRPLYQDDRALKMAVELTMDEYRAIEAATAAKYAERIAELERDLKFVERWANHHGAKPHVTAEEALSVIQHYPGITAITNGYADGKVPDTPNPWAQIAAMERAMNPRRWTRDMNDAWCQNIPNVQAAFEALQAAAMRTGEPNP